MARINVKALRDTLGDTQAQFATRLGVNERTIARWENAHFDPSPLAIRAMKELQAEHERVSQPHRRPFASSSEESGGVVPSRRSL